MLDFLFVNDCTLIGSTAEEMQYSLDRFSTACENFGLTISTQKTEVMLQPTQELLHVEPNVTVKGQS